MPITVPRDYGYTYVNDRAAKRIDVYLAKDDTCTFVEFTYSVDDQDRWSCDEKRDHTLPSPHAARAAMVAYGRDLQSKGFRKV